MEECFLQYRSDMVDEARDQIEDDPEEELNSEAEDREQESSEELEEDPVEEAEQKQLEAEDDPEEELNSEAEDKEEESSKEPEEDPIEEVEQKQLEETILDPGLQTKLGEVPCYGVPECSQLSFYNYKDDREPFKEVAEASLLKQTSECEEPEGDPEDDLVEEVKQKQLKETILDPELDKKLGEASRNEVPVCSQESFYNCNADQTQELFEELSEVSSSKQTSDHDSDKCDHKSGSVKSNDKKRCPDAASGVSTPLIYYQSQKKCKQGRSSGPKLESGPSGLELNNDFVTVVAPNDKSASKEDGTGSSGKRKHSRWEPESEGDGIKDNQTCKRRKTRWSSDDTQIKMLGPLQLPDFTNKLLTGSEKDPEIQGLKAELFEINRKLQRPLHDDRPEEERSPSPEPIYDSIGVRINTQEVRLYQKLVQKRQNIISKLIKSNPTFNPPPDYKPPKLFKKLYVPVKEYPEYNFVGLIIGPRGNTQKRMENETGAKILLRGKGSSKTPNKPASDKEDLHVYIEADDQKSLDAAVAMVERLLIPIEEGRNKHKQAQLKELAMLNGTVRDENACSVCGDEGHPHYACPNFQSTFNMNSCDTYCSNSHLKSACPLAALSPHNDSVQGSGFGFSLSSTQNRQKRPEKKSAINNLYVGNLPQAIDDDRLTELFSPFGKITEAKVVKDRTTGISRGYGFVKFGNAMDAAVAATHFNGFKMDGRFLKVRMAGLLLDTESPGLNHLPHRPGPAGISQNVTNQTDWSGPLHFMLPEHKTSFHDISGMKMFSSTIDSLHDDPKKDLGFTPPGNTSSPSDFSNSSVVHFSYNFSDRGLFSSGKSIIQNPGDPGNPGSQFQSYFMTPAVKTAKLPTPDHRSEEDYDFYPSFIAQNGLQGT